MKIFSSCDLNTAVIIWEVTTGKKRFEIFSRDQENTCCDCKLQFILYFNPKMALLNTLNLLHHLLRYFKIKLEWELQRSRLDIQCVSRESQSDIDTLMPFVSFWILRSDPWMLINLKGSIKLVFCHFSTF